MVVTESIEGVVDNVLWYHYDIPNDVLYLRLLAHRQSPSVSEETPDGLLLLQHADTGQPIGLTLVNWWKRFGSGALPDSIKQLEKRIEPWASRIAA